MKIRGGFDILTFGLLATSNRLSIPPNKSMSRESIDALNRELLSVCRVQAGVPKTSDVHQPEMAKAA